MFRIDYPPPKEVEDLMNIVPDATTPTYVKSVVQYIISYKYTTSTTFKIGMYVITTEDGKCYFNVDGLDRIDFIKDVEDFMFTVASTMLDSCPNMYSQHKDDRIISEACQLKWNLHLQRCLHRMFPKHTLSINLIMDENSTIVLPNSVLVFDKDQEAFKHIISRSEGYGDSNFAIRIWWNTQFMENVAWLQHVQVRSVTESVYLWDDMFKLRAKRGLKAIVESSDSVDDFFVKVAVINPFGCESIPKITRTVEYPVWSEETLI